MCRRKEGRLWEKKRSRQVHGGRFFQRRTGSFHRRGFFAQSMVVQHQSRSSFTERCEMLFAQIFFHVGDVEKDGRELPAGVSRTANHATRLVVRQESSAFRVHERTLVRDATGRSGFEQAKKASRPSKYFVAEEDTLIITPKLDKRDKIFAAAKPTYLWRKML